MVKLNLIKDLTSKDFTTRWFAAEVLGTKRSLSERDIDYLISLLPTSDVAEVIIWVLGRFKVERAIPDISKFLTHTNPYYRWRATYALRDIGTKTAREVLETGLRTLDSETKWKCALALRGMGDIASFEPLWEAASSDEDRYVRWEAICAITFLHGKVEDLVKRKLNSGKLSDFMLWRGVWVLSRVGNRATISWLDSYIKRHNRISPYVRYQIGLTKKAITLKDGNVKR